MSNFEERTIDPLTERDWFPEHPLRRSSDVSPEMFRKVMLNETYGKLGHQPDDTPSLAQRRPNVSPTSAPVTPSPKPWSPSDLKHGDMVHVAVPFPGYEDSPHFFVGLSSSGQMAVLEKRNVRGERMPFSVCISKLVPPPVPEKRITMVAVCFGGKIDMYPHTDFKGPDKTARKITAVSLRSDGMVDVTYSEEPLDWEAVDRLKIPVL
jgi:hypothetical protein